MTLADDTKRVVEQFDFTDDNVNRHVKEFLIQMSMSRHASSDLLFDLEYNLLTSILQIDEGLARDGTSLSQIPTYVTAVPNGTEKVRQL